MTGEPSPYVNNMLEEGARARQVLTAHPELDAQARDIVSKTILGQTLFALWDSGFYEYVLNHARFDVDAAARALGYDRSIFGYLVEYLVGWGLLRAAAGSGPDRRLTELELTERGKSFTNAFSRGVLTLYVGGYQSILTHLGPLLRRELALSDSILDRSAAHAALGTENITCVSIVPAVIAFLEEAGVESVIDLGCGTGGFLLQWTRMGATRSGIGVDLSAEAVVQARRRVEACGAARRLRFFEGEVGTRPIELPADAVAGAQAVTAMFMLHEFGRDGRSEIVEVIRALRRSFPGKLFVFLEARPVDPFALGAAQQPDYFLLDYLLVHPLSRQGLPRPWQDWKAIAEEAGCRDVEVRSLGNISDMYKARF
jgi:SAM-dependent methyltransferase